MYELARTSNGNHEIIVYEAHELFGETGRFRVLQFGDNAVQGAIDLRHPDRIVLEYPREIVRLIRNRTPEKGRIFMIGHGIGTIAGRFREDQCLVAEVNADIVELSRTYFQYGWNNVVIGDGRAILQQQAEGSFDYVILDAFTREGTPHHLMTEEFFVLARQRLKAGGILIMNAAGKLQRDAVLSAIHTTMEQVFASVRAFALTEGERDAERNVLFLGSDMPAAADVKDPEGFIQVQLERGYILRDRV
ncbi:spermidine synthase [Paenibacillus rhizosphaerae]|uniref:Spermidine synthase n=1 Tax=Paenibacillus rhizosphaerae TaxID=297318 RepID=A0A839TIR7_9BACL|nr:fused MFS/spermidine synthase [Paenibacillus rhizosphaerae]MBB3126393.1 spermidine synthase [Paenibacillus rhizosphaerae]